MVRAPLLYFLLASSAFAQFTPPLLQNNSYWGDGKAEFDIYDAQIVREGAPRPCEVLHVLVRESFDPKQLVKSDKLNQPDAIPVLKLNQILHVPIGLYVAQQMHSNFWRVDNAQLLKFSFTSTDSVVKLASTLFWTVTVTSCPISVLVTRISSLLKLLLWPEP